MMRMIRGALLALSAPIHPRNVALLVATLVSVAACSGSDSSTGPSSGPAGSYQLRQIDQENLPVEIHGGPWFDPADGIFYERYLVSVDEGAVELCDCGRFSIWFNASIDGDGTLMTKHVEIDGDWEAHGSVIVLQADGAPGTATLTVHGRTIDLQIDLMGKGVNLDYTFRK